MSTDVQALCEQGQALLMETRYWEAERVLVEAERIAWTARDWDTLARLYMPLQEARRQRRQRAGEGVVVLDLFAQAAGDPVDPSRIRSSYPHGQLLVAGWGSIEPAVRVREMAVREGLYVETFLGAVYPVGGGRVIAIVPTDEIAMPDVAAEWSVDQLIARLPAHSVVLPEAQIPRGRRQGNAQTYAEVMTLWERLAGPFLATADSSTDPIAKAAAYRKTIRVDYACELAHQKLSDLAKSMDRRRREGHGV